MVCRDNGFRSEGLRFSEYLNVTGTVNEDDSSDSGSSDNSNTGTNGEAAKTTTGVHLRSGKGTNYNSLGVIPGGTAITVTDKSDVWYAVTVNGKSGYMYSEYIKLTGTGSSDNNTSSGSTDGSASSDTMRTTAYLNLRSGTGTTTNVLTVSPGGASVTVLEKTTSEWYKVSYGSRTGYVFTEYLK